MNKNFNVLKIILIIVLFFIGVIVLVYLSDSMDSDTDSELDPVAEPRSGEILSGTEADGNFAIKITAPENQSCVVKLKTKSGKTRLSFYVRAGKTEIICAPEEKLYVYFACGETWYGSYHLFGENTGYAKDDEIVDFSETGIEYKLQPVTNGNFTQTKIDEEEFKE